MKYEPTFLCARLMNDHEQRGFIAVTSQQLCMVINHTYGEALAESNL